MNVQVLVQFEQPTQEHWEAMRSLAAGLTDDPGSVRVRAGASPGWLVVDFTMPTEAQAETAVPLQAEATAKERMAAKVSTAAGRALYARWKVIVEPVFGQIKGARGFRRFSLRGLEKINGEWRMVCLTHNPLEVWRYGCAPGAN